MLNSNNLHRFIGSPLGIIGIFAVPRAVAGIAIADVVACLLRARDHRFTPFSKMGACVVRMGLLQGHGDRQVLCGIEEAAKLGATLPSHAHAAENATSRGRADRSGAVGVGESQAFVGQAKDCRGFHKGVA